MSRLFSSFAVKVQVSDAYVTTGLIIVLYHINCHKTRRKFATKCTSVLTLKQVVLHGVTVAF